MMLSAAVLPHLKQLTPAALTTYVYLCSRNQGRPFEASVPVICRATGLAARSVVAALKVLTERQLITRGARNGGKPKRYSVPVPLQVRQPSAPSAPPPSPPPPPPKRSLREVVAACYRPLTDWEFHKLTSIFPDEAILRRKCENLKRKGNTAAGDMPLNFLVAVLERFGDY